MEGFEARKVDRPGYDWRLAFLRIILPANRVTTETTTKRICRHSNAAFLRMPKIFS
jgi:hypothetical protein